MTRAALIAVCSLIGGAGCFAGQAVHITGQSRPVDVRVTNPASPATTLARSEGPGAWVNECQQVARLGASETRPAWLGRIEAFIEQRRDRLASITYPPGDGVEIALVCFSTHAE